MPRKGVGREQVFNAADTLLMQGVRPSVERIRVHLGTGSPNTVTPLLDEWFKALGPRLAGVAPAPGEPADGVPLEVRNAVRQLWDTARKAAEHKSEQALRGEREQLAQELVTVRDKEAALQAARAGLEESARLASARAEDLRAQLQEESARAARNSEAAVAREGQLQEQVRALQATLEEARAAAARHADEHARERRADAERAAANERRHLKEVDHARTELANARAEARHELEALRGELASARARLEQQQQAALDTERRLHTAKSQLAALEKHLAEARAEATAAAKRESAARASAAERLDSFQREAAAYQARSSELATSLQDARSTIAELRRELVAARPATARAGKSAASPSGASRKKKKGH